MPNSLFVTLPVFYFPGTIQSPSIKVTDTYVFVLHIVFWGNVFREFMTHLCRGRNYFDIHSAKQAQKNFISKFPTFKMSSIAEVIKTKTVRLELCFWLISTAEMIKK